MIMFYKTKCYFWYRSLRNHSNFSLFRSYDRRSGMSVGPMQREGKWVGSAEEKQEEIQLWGYL